MLSRKGCAGVPESLGLCVIISVMLFHQMLCELVNYFGGYPLIHFAYFLCGFEGGVWGEFPSFAEFEHELETPIGGDASGFAFCVERFVAGPDSPAVVAGDGEAEFVGL